MLNNSGYYGAQLVRAAAFAEAGPFGLAAVYTGEEATMAAFDQALPYIHKGIDVIAEDAREQARTAAEGEAFAQSVHGAAKGLGIVAATLAGGKALGVMGKGQLGITLNNTTTSILRRPTAAPITTTAPTATPTTRPSQPGAKPHGTSQLGAAKTHGATDLSVSTSAPSAKPGPRKAVRFNDEVEVKKFVQEKKLLPNEGKVGTYGGLKSIENRSSNTAAHHMPHDHYMKTKNVTKDQGIAMQVEHPFPGNGGRHREIHKELPRQDLTLDPREALAESVQRARVVYQQDSLYTPEIRNSLQEVINQNKTTFPELFNKKK